jgi:hypothetical protein
MSYNTFFINTNQTSFSEKDLVAKTLYPKYFIRSNVNTPENKNSLLIDTDSLFFLSLKKKVNLGFSFYAKNVIFSHRLNKKLRFSSFFCYTKVQKDYASNLLVAFDRFSNKPIRQQYLFLMLVKPVKGGFIGFCNNFLGFVPRSQLIFIFKAFFKKTKLLTKKNFEFIFLRSARVLTKFISYKVRIRSASLTLIPCIVRSAFSGRSKYLFLRRKNKVNLVFVYKKFKQKNSKYLPLKTQKYVKIFNSNIRNNYTNNQKYVQHKKA